MHKRGQKVSEDGLSLGTGSNYSKNLHRVQTSDHNMFQESLKIPLKEPLKSAWRNGLAICSLMFLKIFLVFEIWEVKYYLGLKSLIT